MARLVTIARSRLRGLFLLALAVAACGAPPPQVGPPQRIVALAPSNVEILFALGLGERVVGVGDYCVFPPEVAQRPKVGGLFNPNLEAITTLRPDLLLLLPSERSIGEKAAALGLPSLVVASDSLADLDAAIVAIAQRAGVPERGEQLQAELVAALAPRPSLTPRPRVFLSLERPSGDVAELLSAGPGSFYHELLTRLGAENVMADAPVAFPRVSLETVLARQPEWIVELSVEEPKAEDPRQLLADWQRVPQLEAVQAGRVRRIAGGHTVVPGPRLPRLYRELAMALELDSE
jgi:iron complex transport system substrate-binding protein